MMMPYFFNTNALFCWLRLQKYTKYTTSFIISSSSQRKTFTKHIVLTTLLISAWLVLLHSCKKSYNMLSHHMQVRTQQLVFFHTSYIYIHFCKVEKNIKWKTLVFLCSAAMLMILLLWCRRCWLQCSYSTGSVSQSAESFASS